MNLPMDFIHDCLWSYGRLILPTWKRDMHGERRWVAYFFGNRWYGEKKGFRLTDVNGFHNCSSTGIR